MPPPAVGTRPCRKLLERDGWRDESHVPDRDTERTIPGGMAACISQVYFIRYVNRRQTFHSGEKPKHLKGVRPKQRRWQSFLSRKLRDNAIRVADRFLAQANLPSHGTYAQVAAHFGVSRVMVCYHLALLTRLPAYFVEWLRACDDPMLVGYFTERRLRPLTRIDDPAKQKQTLDQMTRDAQAMNPDGAQTADPSCR